MPKAITGKWLSACINKLIDERTILINEYPTVLEEMTIKEPGRYFGNASAGGLGWGFGAPLPAQLPPPHKTVISPLGRPAPLFGQPPPRPYLSAGLHLPAAFIIPSD